MYPEFLFKIIELELGPARVHFQLLFQDCLFAIPTFIPELLPVRSGPHFLDFVKSFLQAVTIFFILFNNVRGQIFRTEVYHKFVFKKPCDIFGLLSKSSSSKNTFITSYHVGIAYKPFLFLYF